MAAVHTFITLLQLDILKPANYDENCIVMITDILPTIDLCREKESNEN